MAQQCFKSLKRNGTQSGTNETVSDMWRMAECSGFFTCFLSMPHVSDVIELIELKSKVRQPRALSQSCTVLGLSLGSQTYSNRDSDLDSDIGSDLEAFCHKKVRQKLNSTSSWSWSLVSTWVPRHTGSCKGKEALRLHIRLCARKTIEVRTLAAQDEVS